ncbi:MAG TPA: DUF2252 domain-containing protein [Alphaproteobacteria bacterium]|nr:DUF2252 domain-containing protein [Alphaproteobacteria bacterium]
MSQAAVALFQPPVPIAERHAAGVALRSRVPRESHSFWMPASDRPDPVDIIIASDEGREENLIPIRHTRMVSSAFAFLRGSAAAMAWDLSRLPTTGVRVQACGDCHLMNFGGFATPERNIVFDINDFDETLPAPWEWDVKRLAASVAVAARHIGLTDAEARKAAYATTVSYCDKMGRYAGEHALDVWYDKLRLDDVLKEFDGDAAHRVRGRIKAMEKKTIEDHYFPKLTENVGGMLRIKDAPPLIYHHPDQQRDGYLQLVAEAFEGYRQSLPDHHALLFDRFRLHDLAVKVVGVGSVGTVCWVTLFTASESDPLFLQIKQANRSVLEPYAGGSLYGNHGQRVVAGQRLMQTASDIFLGWSLGTLHNRHYYVRQLRDMKISALVESFDFDTLQTYGRICGWALARAHARSGDPVVIAGYVGGGKVFSAAIAKFAMAYADQTERDHHRMAEGIRDGRLAGSFETGV